MNKAKTRKLPLNCYCEISRHGKQVYYYREGKGKRIRLPAFGTPEFKAAHKAAIAEYLKPAAPPPPSKTTTLRWLISQYMGSAQWASLSTATRKQRGLLYKKSVEKSGDVAFRHIATKHILNGLNDRQSTPFIANNYLKAMRGLFGWARLNGHIDSDPTVGVKALPTKTDGFPAWDMEDVHKFCEKHPIGTKARLAFELLLQSGLRRSDICIAGKQHMNGNVFTIRTAKTGTTVTVEFPPQLMDIIAQTKTGSLHFITGEKGNPFTAESFTNWFREMCRQAGVMKSSHGIRKLSATLSANGGATVHELNAQYGWTTFRQAEIYTKGAERARLGMKTSRILAEQIEATKPLTKSRTKEKK